MNRMFRHTAAALTAAVMMLAALPVAANAEGTEKKNIVFIGDSTLTGSSLKEGEKNTVQLVEEYLGVTATSFTQDDYQLADVNALLDDASVQAALAEADVIVVSVGLHDVMDQFVVRAHEILSEVGLEEFSQLYSTSFEQLGKTEDELRAYSNELAKLVRSCKTVSYTEMLEIGDKLSQYPDALVILENVYNPMNTIRDFDKLTDNRQLAYGMVSNPIDGVLKLTSSDYVNGAITQLVTKKDFLCVDTFTQFAGQAYQYAHPEELDINMTFLASQWVAGEIITDMGNLKPGDVNGDNTIDSSDAAMILEYAADEGAEAGSGTLNVNRRAAANITAAYRGDEDIDSTDAAYILQYAALEGAGQGVPFAELIQ